jgi:putative intracellular protease/amidase
MVSSKLKAVLLMADYGNDPTEVATPFNVFEQAGFDVSFATETGKVPECGERMLKGWTGKLLVRGWAGLDGIEASAPNIRV